MRLAKDRQLNCTKRIWSLPKIMDLGNVETITKGAGPGKADMGEGNFGVPFDSPGPTGS